MYAQIIDDTVGNTLVAASTMDKDVKAACEKTNNVDAAAVSYTHLDVYKRQGYEMTKEILSNKVRPDGIICANNYIAYGCVNALHHAGIETVSYTHLR